MYFERGSGQTVSLAVSVFNRICAMAQANTSALHLHCRSISALHVHCICIAQQVTNGVIGPAPTVHKTILSSGLASALKNADDSAQPPI
mmetsp:Transcript_100882/g.170612  ORF Transcript_100882/g.170612 Transcript_100882/m.170612 type:complete len:89 (+) Transcript_100882:223-489(+)